MNGAESNVTVDSVAGTTLANGMQQSLNQLEIMFDELLAKQELLLEQCEQPEFKVDQAKLQIVQQNISKTQLYLKKLPAIRKDMINLHVKAEKLKSRAAAVEQQQMQVAHKRSELRSYLDQQDEQLIAKPVDNTKRPKS